MSNKTVLVIGTGTIGEPLIGLLSRLKHSLGIDRVIFHKRTPLDYEIAKVNSLVAQGASLAVDKTKWKTFQDLGHSPNGTFGEALRAADVIIDCTPAGNDNKDKHYLGLDAEGSKRRVFIAQGSEKGFGIPYAHGINDDVLLRAQSQRFIQVVSCNTHAIGRLIKSLNTELDKNFISGDFVCVRRANDTSQNSGFTPSPTCGEHTDKRYGTHHARDVSDLLSTITGKPTNIFSSAMKVNSQYMHAIRFSIVLNEKLSETDVISRFREDKFVTLTRHKTANKVFSYGRDHGFYGRIYNQVVVCLPSLGVFSRYGNKKTLVTGFAFTPQDGNSLLSSVAACLYGLHDEDHVDYLNPILEFLQDEV
jgi:glyceraldehyde-3-phosphate dehydrogenase (NAD(P))